MCQQMIDHWAEGKHLLTNATSVTTAECDYVVRYYAASGILRILFLMIIIVPQWRRLTSLTRYFWREDVFMLATPNRVIFWRTIAILCIHGAMAQIAMNDIGAILMQVTYIVKLSIASQSDDPEACARTIIDSLGGTISDLSEWGTFMYNLVVLLMVINSVGAVYFLWIELIQLVSFVSLHRTVLFMRVCFGLHLFGAFVFVLLVGPVGKVALEIPKKVFQLLMVIIIGIFGYKYSAMVRLSVHSINEGSKATSVAKLRTLVRGIAKFVVWYLALQALQFLFDEILTDHAACPADESVTLLKLLMLTRITSDITYYFDRSKEKDWFNGRSSTASAFRRVTVVPVSAMAQRISSAPFHPPSLARGASLSRLVPSMPRGESASKVGAW